MSGVLQGNGQDPEALQEMQEELEREREQRQQAQQLAGQHSDKQPLAKEELLRLITDLGLDSEHHDDHMEDYLSAELSHIYALSSLSPKDISKFDWRVEQDSFLMRNEMKRQNSGMDQSDERIMYGDTKPELTDSKQRRLRSAEQAKKFLLRLSRDGEFLKSQTEIRAVSETKNRDGDDESEGGRLSRMADKLV